MRSPRHTPSAHLSSPLHTSPSLHSWPSRDAVSYVMAPVAGSHASAVQGLPSSMPVRGMPTQVLVAGSHASLWVQAFPSLHGAPASAVVQSAWTGVSDPFS